MEPKRNWLTTSKHEIFTLSFVILFSVFFKVTPHFPNFSPLLVLFLYLGNILPRSLCLAVIFVVAVLSDLAVAIGTNFPPFGSWTLFTYSGFLIIGLCGRLKWFSVKNFRFILASISLSFIFWIWTNAGVWLLSGMYPATLMGLIHCYLLALPFLNNSLMAAFLWGSIFFALTRYHFLPWPKKALVYEY